MKTIFKYTLKETDYQELEMPCGAQALSCQLQHDKIQLWALVDTDVPLRKYSVWIETTGHPLKLGPSKEFLGTIQIANGLGIFHVFVQADLI